MSLITLNAGRRWAVLVNRPLVAFSRAYTLIPSTPHPAAAAAAATTENPVVKNQQEQDYNTIHAFVFDE
ncbi:hypothetical protein MBANPS3_005416 [Mucor bainieri]